MFSKIEKFISFLLFWKKSITFANISNFFCEPFFFCMIPPLIKTEFFSDKHMLFFQTYIRFSAVSEYLDALSKVLENKVKENVVYGIRRNINLSKL